MNKKIIIQLCLILFLIPVQGLTKIINVPGDYVTIQEALNAASEGYTVKVAPGTYTENIVWPEVNGIKLIGSGVDETIIDGDQKGNVIRFLSSVIQSETKLDGVMITNGLASNGGGIYCYNSSPSLSNVTISVNTANGDGGGIYCYNSSINLSNVKIDENVANDDAGGMYFFCSNPILSNVTITENSANDDGGGIFCNNSTSTFIKVTIIKNTAKDKAGGIYCIENSTILFDSNNSCNLYSNKALTGTEYFSDKEVSIIVDTFTVATPTAHHAYPIENFSFDIKQSIQPQINSNIYVSPSGSNSNLGTSEDSPLKTIQYALSVIAANNIHPYTIFLDSGIYSPDTNGEIFPLYLFSYVSIIGKEEKTTILNADGNNQIFYLYDTQHNKIDGLTITNGSGDIGGGMYMKNSNPYISNVTITKNSANHIGGGIYCFDSNPSFAKVTISKNFAISKGGGIYLNSSIINFDQIKRCNIYSNSSKFANDIYSTKHINIIVDTFTVATPTDYYAYPIENFSFDINESLIPQRHSYIYVSPSGNNSNEGTSVTSPIKSIQHALNTIAESNDNSYTIFMYTIFLDSGIYSANTNGETFPLNIPSNVKMIGEGIQETILNANGEERVLCLQNINNTKIEGITITNGATIYDGGGVYCKDSILSLSNIMITGNSANGDGGGIYCAYSASLRLSNVTITENTANNVGGGIYSNQSHISFSNDTPNCNIYSNNALSGNDLYSTYPIDIIVDTFTVATPTTYHAIPIENFSFAIKKSILPQTSSNIYVSPSGNNSNEGTSEDSPLKTIQYALSIIAANEDHPYTIFLDSGIYSPGTNGEIFPISLISYVSIEGKDKNKTILNANGENQVLYLNNVQHAKIIGITITNGFSENHGGGVYLWKSNPTFSNVTISENISNSYGGGINCYDSNPIFSNVTITKNSANTGGGGVCFTDSSPSLMDVSIIKNKTNLSGGGLYCYNSKINFDDVNRCNIYSNSSESGHDIYSNQAIKIIVETFTVATPTKYYAKPIENFSFDIIKSIIPQTIYISPLGDDSNNGISETTPFKTIQHALSIIADDGISYTIYLDSGTYSPDTNGETFPLTLSSNVNIIGKGENETILNANGEERVLYLNDIKNTKVESLNISNGLAANHGGGVYCHNSTLSLSNITITGNTANYGGGIFCSENSILSLSNVTITENIANYYGGGICVYDSIQNLTNVTITENTANYYGGGIRCYNSNTNFDSENRCNIYSNSSAKGNDIYSNQVMNIVVDTFTVKTPTPDYAYPINNFSFDIKKSIIPQMNSYLFVSPLGNNNNEGTSENKPFKTIQHALSVIAENNDNSYTILIYTIYLDSGTYSPNTNGETFPLNMSTNLSIKGKGQNETILNANGEASVFNLNKVHNAKIEGITITNGLAKFGGGIYCYDSILSLSNVTITENSAYDVGGGIYCSESIIIFDNENLCNIYSNNAVVVNDIYSTENINIIVDKFTVETPTSFYACPIENFSFNIKQSILPQIYSDLYVSLSGNNSNEGTTEELPLKTIQYALSVIAANNDHPYTIFLDSGTYSQDTNGEIFPLNIFSYVSIKGKGEDKSILDANGENRVLDLRYVNYSQIDGITITNGTSINGGGILCSFDSNPSLSNVKITGNIASDRGGGIFCSFNANPSLSNVVITGNIANNGGGMYLNQSNPSLSNVNITENASNESGGGVFCHLSEISFDNENRCNIYSNSSENGNDIYSNQAINIIVDTFTVVTPTAYYAYPIENFSFDIIKSIIPQIIYVSPLGNDSNNGISETKPFKTIQHALSIIADDENPYTIFLGSGTYSQNTNGEIFPLNIPNNISFIGKGENKTTLNANGEERVLYLNNVHNCKIKGIKITNGLATDGGGIYLKNSSPNLSNIIISNNSATNSGGGVYCDNSSPNFSDITFYKNSAMWVGGGIYCDVSSSSFSNITVVENSAKHKGGGIYFDTSSPSLSNVLLTKNAASFYGGGVYSLYSNPIFSNIKIFGNMANKDGGGIYCDNSSSNISNLIMTENSAKNNGGGFYFDNSNPSLSNVIITKNTASNGNGGGIYCAYSNPNFLSVTITENLAQEYAGAIYCSNSTIEFDDNLSKIYLNHALFGNDLYSNESISFTLDTFTVTTPSNFHASPIDNFSFNIKNSFLPQENSNIFVSPLGNNLNDGTSESTPLQTIQYALSLIATNNEQLYTIFLDSGTYSSHTNDETFPLYLFNYVSIKGKDEKTTILDANGENNVLYFKNVNYAKIDGVTIRNGSGDNGGGIYCDTANPRLSNVIITENQANAYGGGIYCENSNPILSNVTISKNIAINDGGGISCSENSNLSLTNATISENSTNKNGGGIYCSISDLNLLNVSIYGNLAKISGGGIFSHNSHGDFSRLNLSNVTVFENSASEDGGGICFFYYTIDNFNNVDRCNIYSNNALFGNDIYTVNQYIDLVLDAFTVATPTAYHVYPIDNYSFDINKGILSQENSDIYVSPSGNNFNDGTSENSPLKTIQHALSIIADNKENPHTIYLDSGIYSPKTNGERFPLPLFINVSIQGKGKNKTILDANGEKQILYLKDIHNIKIDGLSITNGFAENGGGIYCSNATPNLSNLLISNNTANKFGGGIYSSDSSPNLSNVTISENIAKEDGGGMYCSDSSCHLTNVTIIGNSANKNGGGVYCSEANSNFLNVTIIENIANIYGGGIYCVESTTNLTNVLISDNLANEYGGGIYCDINSSMNFNNENRCSIFQNSALHYKDIYTKSELNLVLDTFTVKIPTAYYVFPLDNFFFDIKESILSQIHSNIYVSPSGNDSNDGVSEYSPLKTIQYALSVITANNERPYTIFLDSGVYSPDTNGEKYPLQLINYVFIKGKGENESILNANGKNQIFYLYNAQHVKIDGIMITKGFATDGGGGIFCIHSTASLSNMAITQNTASIKGGGIYCYDSHLNLSNVSISKNTANDVGGGIYSDDTDIHFDTENRCNIFENKSLSGNDLFSNKVIDVVVDTFTVKVPTDYHANPIEKFTFDIKNSMLTQIHSDIYVSPFGNDSNEGTSDAPLKSIQYALSIIGATVENPCIIHLGAGTYSPKTNEENFPLSLISHVSIIGKGESRTILNANGENQIFYMKDVQNTIIEGITITNGWAENGGGIYCSNSSPTLSYLNLTDNSANSDGGGVYFTNSSHPVLKNVNISENITNRDGGGIFSDKSDPTLVNVTISRNLAEKGGGMYCKQCENLNFSNLTIIGNTANDGGGIYTDKTNLDLVNSILWHNTPQAIYHSPRSPLYHLPGSNLLTINYSNIQNGYEGIFSTGTTIYPFNRPSRLCPNRRNCRYLSGYKPDPIIVALQDPTINWEVGNISDPPQFIDPYDNFQLQPDSPCINTGHPDLDDDGISWVKDPNDQNPDGSRLDMGAHYFPYNLTLTIPDQILENHGVQRVSVNTNYTLTQDCYIHLISSEPNIVSVPASVIIPAGYTLVTFDVTIQDNADYDIAKTVVISAKLWKEYTQTLRVIDDELWVSIDHPTNNTSSDQLMIIVGRANDRFNDISGIQVQISEGNKYVNESFEFGTTPVWIDAQEVKEWTLPAYKINWKKDTAYSITARATNTIGYTATATVTYINGNLYKSSTITCELVMDHIEAGESIEIFGKIDPPPKSGETVDLDLEHIESGETIKYIKSVYTNKYGEFLFQVDCGKINIAGQWAVQTSWEGNEKDLLGAKSDIQNLSVSSSQSQLFIETSSSHIKIGESVVFSGKLSYQTGCDRGLHQQELTLKIIDPNGIEKMDPNTIKVDNFQGFFKTPQNYSFDSLGKWQVEIAFNGYQGISPCTSELIDIHVVETAGYAIIIQGIIKDKEGVREHNKTTRFVYNQFKKRDFFIDEVTKDDDIMYLNYHDTQSGVDQLPTKESVRNAITQWAPQKMDQKPANLYIVMVDHGLSEKFYIYPDIITSSDLAEWLNTLQTNLMNEDAQKQEIVVILGFCKSGSFIDELSGRNRVIITSASKDEYSYKGPKEIDETTGKIIRDGEYFITEFFKKISFGQSIKESFEKAALLTQRYTLFPSGTPNAPYFDKSQQHPLMDDNGDKIGSHILSDPKGDGEISKNLYIGTSSYTRNNPGDVSIVEVSDDVFMPYNESTTDQLWAKVDAPDRLGTMWVEIKTPDYEPIPVIFDQSGFEVFGQAEMDLKKVFYDLPINQDRNSSYKYTWTGLEGFTKPGTYQVFYFAIDYQTRHVSPLMETIVYKAKAGNRPPSPFLLISPSNNLIDTESDTNTNLIFRWHHTTDPDNDLMTYNVLLSEKNKHFNNPIQKNSLSNNGCMFNKSNGIKNLTRYYWKVIAIDQYGARQESDIWSFYTDNKENPAWGALEAYVYNEKSGQLVDDASVIVGNLSSAEKTSNGYYLDFIPPGDYNITIKADGFITKNYPDIEIPRMDTLVRNFSIMPEVENGELKYILSGTVKDSNGNPISNILIEFNENDTSTTNSSGAYSKLVDSSSTVNIKPIHNCHSFTPTHYSISDINANDTKDFIAHDFNIDIDKNGKADALSDGLLIIYYLLDGNISITDTFITIDSGECKKPEEVEDYIKFGYKKLDIDCNDKTEALTDGLLILRYLFNIDQGDSLIKGAVDKDRGQCLSETEILKNIESILPKY